MTTTDIIEIIGIIASTSVSIVAIVISVMTLKQNNKMILYESENICKFWIRNKNRLENIFDLKYNQR